MPFVDTILNRITMYRLVLYYLCVLLAAAFVFCVFHLLPYHPANLVFSAVLIILVCWVTNRVFAKAFGAIPNIESIYITALILSLIVTPVPWTDAKGIGALVVVSALAMGSKYIVTLGNKLIFNPAAFAVALGALLLSSYASWWVGGNMPMLALVLVGGLLVVRKIRRFDLVLTFLAVASATVILTAEGSSPVTALTQVSLHSPLLFLAFVMLTEPLTMPPSRVLRMGYAGLVGVLFAPHVHIGSYYFTPEIALLVGNVFTYIVSPKGRFILTLLEKREIARGTYEFIFRSDRPLPYRAGQYIEWTLDGRGSDDRGNRRYFTIASSPTEPGVRLGVKYYDPSSTFKQTLRAMPEEALVTAAQIAGDFTLPQDRKKKLVFIAGGIGVTPFRSMAKYLTDTNEVRTVTMFYSNNTAADIAYKEVFDDARKIGMETIYVLTKEPAPVAGTYSGFIDATLIANTVPDYKERLFYISGPNGMVEAFKKTLRGMGVSRFNIKSDYFPGF